MLRSRILLKISNDDRLMKNKRPKEMKEKKKEKKLFFLPLLQEQRADIFLAQGGLVGQAKKDRTRR